MCGYRDSGFWEGEAGSTQSGSPARPVAREPPLFRHLLPRAGLPSAWASRLGPATATYRPVCSSLQAPPGVAWALVWTLPDIVSLKRPELLSCEQCPSPASPTLLHILFVFLI